MLKIFLNSVKMNLSIVNMSTICLFNDRSSSLQTNQIIFTSYQLPVTSCWLMVRGMIEGRPTPSTTLSLLSHPSPPSQHNTLSSLSPFSTQRSSRCFQRVSFNSTTRDRLVQSRSLVLGSAWCMFDPNVW
jgi:hypothetical protein